MTGRADDERSSGPVIGTAGCAACATACRASSKADRTSPSEVGAIVALSVTSSKMGAAREASRDPRRPRVCAERQRRIVLDGVMRCRRARVIPPVERAVAQALCSRARLARPGGDDLVVRRREVSRHEERGVRVGLRVGMRVVEAVGYRWNGRVVGGPQLDFPCARRAAGNLGQRRRRLGEVAEVPDAEDPGRSRGRD